MLVPIHDLSPRLIRSKEKGEAFLNYLRDLLGRRQVAMLLPGTISP